MKKNAFICFNIAALIFAAVLILAISIWAPACSGQLELANGKFVSMKCVYTVKACILISVILIAASLENIIKKRFSPLIYIVIGIVLILITFTSSVGIGICMKEEMACHTSALWIRILGGLTLADGVITFFLKDKHSL